MLVVTGAQRSGTRYLATVLARAGLDATHEGNSPGQGWRDHDPRNGPRLDVDVDVCWHSAWWLDQPELTEATVVHLVRHPLASIASSVTRRTFWRPRPSGKWAIERMPHLAEGSNIERCAVYWHDWNALIEGRAHQRVRVEDLTTDVLSNILDAAGIDHSRAALADAADATPTDTNTNATRRREVSWADIPEPVRSRVQTMGRRYGY